MSLSFSGGSAFGEVGMAQQLQDVAKQLSFQMEYNTDLLAQLQRLEEEHLVFQKGAADKQAALRQALAVADAARADANDAKRRLAIAQEVAVKLSEELKEARVEGGALRRQLEALEARAAEAAADLRGLHTDKSSAAAQVCVRGWGCGCVCVGLGLWLCARVAARGREGASWLQRLQRVAAAAAVARWCCRSGAGVLGGGVGGAGTRRLRAAICCGRAASACQLQQRAAGLACRGGSALLLDLKEAPLPLPLRASCCFCGCMQRVVAAPVVPLRAHSRLCRFPPCCLVAAVAAASSCALPRNVPWL
jgi:hypothetical protein